MKYKLLLLFAVLFGAALGQAAEITASVETLDFGEVEIGYLVTKSFTVTGSNLSGNINLEVTGRKSNYYQVTPQTITPQEAAGGVRVTVKCSPASYYITPASILLTRADAEDVVVPIAVDPYYPEAMFYNNQVEEFTALVGQIVKRSGSIRFADAEIPPIPDPDTPVVRSYINFDATLLSGDYSLEIEGPDSNQFFATITKSSSIAKICTVVINYAPHSTGTHEATLKVYCSRAGVPLVTIPLHGETTGMLCDLDGNGVLDITDLTSVIGFVLGEDDNPSRGDFDGDGRCDIDDVTKFISFLLNIE